MNDFHGKTVHEIAGDWRVQAAVRQLDRLRAAEMIVSDLATKLMLAEQELLTIQRELEGSRGKLR